MILALLAHALLLAVLIFNLNWRTETPGPVAVQLWADGNSPVSPTPPPQPQPDPEPPKPQPEPEPEKTPEPEPQALPKTETVDPEIALQQARKKREQEEQAQQAAEAAKERVRIEEERKQADLKEKKRLEQERQAAEKTAAAEKAEAEKAAAEKKAKEDAAKKAAAEKAAAEKAAEKKKAKEDAAKKAAADKALKDAFRSDALGAAGIPGGAADRNQTGGAGGRDVGYGAKVRACVQPGVAYPTPPRSGAENPTAQYQVKLNTTDGKVTAVTITQSSGIAAFDRAIESGIRRCNPFPKPSNGRYEPSIYGEYSMY